MKTLIIYYSVHHGNTEKIVQIMEEKLNALSIKANNLNIDELENFDLIGFASGIFFRKHHKKIFEVIDKTPIVKGKRAFVCSTSGTGNKKYNIPLINKLKEKGYKIIKDFSCKGYDTFGPFKIVGGINKGRPNNKDLKNAEVFAVSLYKSLH